MDLYSKDRLLTEFPMEKGFNNTCVEIVMKVSSKMDESMVLEFIYMLPKELIEETFLMAKWKDMVSSNG
jgi:hypothetical protein